MKTILAAVDFSSANDSVVTASLELARAMKGRVVLLTVVQPPIITSEYAAAMLENYEEATAAAAQAAARRLLTLQKRFKAARIPTKSIHLTGSPASQILSHARDQSADYIVMGSHGHTAFYDLLVGSTTHAVLRRAPCPVIIVPRGKKNRSGK
jgi:nucleotide-binding universal stress UspA family protein